MFSKLLSLKTIFIASLAVIFVISSMKVLQTPSSILQEVVVNEQAGQIDLQIKTNIALHYVDHFPKGPTDFVQIRI